MERDRVDKVVAPFKAGHMAYTSKYEMFWQMKQEKEDKRRETRRAREEALMASVRPIGQLEERMIANNEKKEKQFELAQELERESYKFENAIGRRKPIPNYQREWDQQDYQMQKKKEEDREELEEKFGHLKPVRLEPSKMVVPVKDELEEVNR